MICATTIILVEQLYYPALSSSYWREFPPREFHRAVSSDRANIGFGEFLAPVHHICCGT